MHVWTKIGPSNCTVERCTNPVSRSKALAGVLKNMFIASLTCGILLMRSLLCWDSVKNRKLP